MTTSVLIGFAISSRWRIGERTEEWPGHRAMLLPNFAVVVEYSNTYHGPRERES